jgi:hypothetical protein
LTLDRFLKKHASRTFHTTADALRMLSCKRMDYKEGEKNVWYVDMPEFVNHQVIKKNLKKNEISEMDEEYHDKFRDPKTKEPTQKDD